MSNPTRRLEDFRFHADVASDKPVQAGRRRHLAFHAVERLLEEAGVDAFPAHTRNASYLGRLDGAARVGLNLTGFKEGALLVSCAIFDASGKLNARTRKTVRTLIADGQVTHTEFFTVAGKLKVLGVVEDKRLAVWDALTGERAMPRST